MRKSPSLAAFTGAMGVGKSTAIEALTPFTKGIINLKFADPLYSMQDAIYGIISKVYKRPTDFVKDRKLLQWLGTEWGRDTISKTLWVDLWKSELDYCSENYSWVTVTCDDVRFDNEAELVRANGGIIIKLVSNRNTNVSFGGTATHSSEYGVNYKYVDYVVENNGTLEEFKKSLSTLYKEIFEE